MNNDCVDLPLNCTVQYYQNYLSQEEAEGLLQFLLQLTELTSPAITVALGARQQRNYGKLMFITKDSMNEGKFPESVCGNTALWPQILLPIKKELEELTGRVYGNCVCIYYPDGSSGVAFHSDYRAFGDTTVVPSISLGEERDFSLRERSTQKISTLTLAHGSLIIMGEHCQDRYEHSLPTNPMYENPRINLTFRSVD